VSRRRQAVQAPRKRVSNNEWAKTIVGDLRRHSGLAIEEAWAIRFTKGFIEDLHGLVQFHRAEPQPNVLKKQIASLTGHARALATGINKFGVYSFYTLAYASNPNALARNSEALSKTREWIAGLNKIAGGLEQMNADRRQIHLAPKLLCGFWTVQLIDALSPTTKLTTGEGSQFYRTAEDLWEAVSGKRESMKKQCDCIVKRNKMRK
jgi:hypothetical protein